MADHLKIDKAQIDAAFERRDFESLNALLTSVPYSSSELIKFYRQRSASRIPPTQRLFALKEFWASKLPHFHLKSILESDIKVDFLRCYFSENKFCNPELDRHILVIARGDYIRHFKLWMAFNHSNYLASIKQMCASDPELAVVVKELEIIIKAQEKIKEELTSIKLDFVKNADHARLDDRVRKLEEIKIKALGAWVVIQGLGVMIAWFISSFFK